MEVPAVNPDAIRTANPSTWPQYPYDLVPATREQSQPRYRIHMDERVEFGLRDGVTLTLDVYRPAAPGERFPSLFSFSPYTRQLQRTDVPIGQNESGISEFWVPRGYAHVIVDIRGSNDSQGDWDMWGPTEQQDMVEVIEWIGAQPWCNGSVGGMGCSYQAMTQVLAATHNPPALKAVFPYDAAVDHYRDLFYTGGIPHDGFMRTWFSDVEFLNLWGGRLRGETAMRQRFLDLLGDAHPTDDEYHRSRSAWPRLPNIKIPMYLGCHWTFFPLHLRASFLTWESVPSTRNRMLIGPSPVPARPFAAYHQEALRWYDQHLKGFDTGVDDGPPIRIFVRGDNAWRGEDEWPLRRTHWTDLFLGGPEGGHAGTLDQTPGAQQGRTFEYSGVGQEYLWGRPRIAYRTEPFASPTEITGPLVLRLSFQATAEDVDWIAKIYDESPDGETTLLTYGMLRSSHRALDPKLSTPHRPWHSHDGPELLSPKTTYELDIEIVPNSNVFLAGHRLKLEIANADSLPENYLWYRRMHNYSSVNTILEGGPNASFLRVPVIPR